MAEPEAPAAEVQADPRQAAIDAAAQELGRGVDGEPLEQVEPEAGADGGTGGEELETPTEEIDWTDAEARAAEFARRDTAAEEARQESLQQQRRSMQGQLDLADQAQRERQRQTLLTELDQLKVDDPEAYSRRLDDDGAAAQAVADRAVDINPAVIERAQMLLATRQAEQLFEVIPDLRGHAETGDEEWGKVINPETGGMFGYLKTRFGTEAVMEFKDSKEFKDAIAEAEARGTRTALPDAAGAPPSEPETPGTPPEPRQQFDDPAQQAVADAMRERGVTGVDISRIRTRRSGARA